MVVVNMIILKEIPLFVVFILFGMGAVLGALLAEASENKENVVLSCGYAVIGLVIIGLVRLLPEWMVGMIIVGAITLFWCIKKVS